MIASKIPSIAASFLSWGTHLDSYDYRESGGTRLASTLADGIGLAYIGSMTYRTSSGGAVLESVDFGGGKLMADSSGTFRPLYHVTDRLGSVRVICDGAGTVFEKNDYYPSGLKWETSTPQFTDNRLKFNGKEDQLLISETTDAGAALLHYGARLYSPALIRWLSPDPLAEQYYSSSSYAFCASNPVNIIDPDGCRVFPRGTDELDMIKNTLPKEDHKFVQFDNHGYIDQELMKFHESKSNNYHTLMSLVSSDRTLFVMINGGFTFMQNDRTLGYHKMNYLGIDPAYIGNSGGTGVGTSTGETGFLGKTLFPDLSGRENSFDNNLYVIINTHLSPLGRAETFAHEAYGHAYLYDISGGNRRAATHNYGTGSTDKNRTLFLLINQAINETTYNYNN